MEIEKTNIATAYFNNDFAPYSRQTDLISKTGYWYEMCQWYSNRYDITHGKSEGRKIADVNFELTEENEEFSLCEVDNASLGYFDALIPGSLIKYIKGNKKAASEIRLLGVVNAKMEACGLIAVRIREKSACEIVWIYLVDELRHRGLGRLLLAGAYKLIEEAEGKEIYFLSGHPKTQEDTTSISRLSKHLNCSTEVVTEHFVAVSIDRFLVNFSDVGGCEDCFYLYEVPSEMIDHYLDTFEDADRERMNGLRRSRSHGGEILPYFKAFSKESCVFVKNGKITGMLLYVEREDRRGLVLVAMKSKDQACLAKMMNFSIESAKRTYGADGWLTFAALNGIGKAMGGYYKIDDEWIRVVCSYLPIK